MQLLPVLTCVFTLISLFSVGQCQYRSIRKDHRSNINALTLLNRYRSFHRAHPLIYNDTLALHALEWANTLIDKAIADNKLELYYSHPKVEGESISIMDKLEEQPASTMAIQTWYDEKKWFNFTTGEFSYETAQFTQLVWRHTKQIGIANIYDPSSKYAVIVARFYPAGNIGGTRSFQINVLDLDKHALSRLNASQNSHTNHQVLQKSLKTGGHRLSHLPPGQPYQNI